MCEDLTKSSVVACEVDVADDASSYGEGRSLEAGLHAFEAGLNGNTLVRVGSPHQVRLVIPHVPAVRKERLAVTFVHAQVFVRDVGCASLLDNHVRSLARLRVVNRPSRPSSNWETRLK